MAALPPRMESTDVAAGSTAGVLAEAPPTLKRRCKRFFIFACCTLTLGVGLLLGVTLVELVFGASILRYTLPPDPGRPSPSQTRIAPVATPSNATGPSAAGEAPKPIGSGAPAARKPSQSVLYVVATWHKNYPTKAKAVVDTWGAKLGERLLLVGDDETEDLPIVVADECKRNEGGHHLAHICKLLYALVFAQKRMKDEDLSWVMVVDDDAYVRVRNVDEALHAVSAKEKVAYGCLGCGPKLCEDKKGGFCGGCGFALSRAALAAVVGDSVKAFVEEGLAVATSGLSRTGNSMWGDITISCLLKRRKGKLKQLKGLYGWKLRPRDKQDVNSFQAYRAVIHSKSVKPLTFHYVNPDMMRWIHKEFKKGGERRLLRLRSGGGAVEGSARRAPCCEGTDHGGGGRGRGGLASLRLSPRKRERGG